MNIHFVSPRGAVAFWDAGPTNRTMLEHLLTQIGLEAFLPPVRSDSAALKLAMAEYAEGQRARMRAAAKAKSQATGQKVRMDKIVQPHLDQKQNGFELVSVERGARENAYGADFSARVTEEGKVLVTRGFANVWEIQEYFAKHKGTVGGDGVGRSLVELVQHLGGTTLREVGGVYWLPDSALETWSQVINAFQMAGPKTKVYMMQTVMGAETIRAVKDAIVSEVSASAGSLVEEIRAGSLGAVALENRKTRASQLHERVKQYEEILQDTLEHLHQVIAVAETAAASALAVQEDSQVFDQIYAA